MYSWVLEHYLALSFLCIGWNSVHELQPFSIYLDHMHVPFLVICLCFTSLTYFVIYLPYDSGTDEKTVFKCHYKRVSKAGWL